MMERINIREGLRREIIWTEREREAVGPFWVFTLIEAGRCRCCCHRGRHRHFSGRQMSGHHGSGQRLGGMNGQTDSQTLAGRVTWQQLKQPQQQQQQTPGFKNEPNAHPTTGTSTHKIAYNYYCYLIN